MPDVHFAARRLSLFLFTALAVFLILFGVLYAGVSGYLPFHAAALPEETRQSGLPLYMALMKLIGGATATLGAMCIYLTWNLRRPFAAEVVASAIAVPVLMAAYVAETLADATGAPTSWHIMGGLLAVDALAYAAWRLSGRESGRPEAS